MKPVIAVCGLIGIVIVIVAWQWDARRTAAATAATEEYGRRLIVETSVLIGPDQPDPAMRYTGSRLQCGSCHLKAGAEPGTLSLLETDPRYPRPSGRDGLVGDIKLRLNGCMTRSMNGRALPLDSPEMNAMVAYLRALNGRFMLMEKTRRAVHEPKPFATPDRAASPVAGRGVFDALRALSRRRRPRPPRRKRSKPRLSVSAALGTRQFQRRRGHASRVDGRAVHQSAHAARPGGPDR